MILTGELTLPRTTAPAQAHTASVGPLQSPAIDLPALVHQHSSILFRAAYSILRSRPDSEDVVQETFLRALQHARSLPPPEAQRPWLIRVAVNLALDRRRRIQPGQLDDAFAASLVAATLPADQAVDAARAVTHVLAAIDRLPAAERKALLLSALDELPTPELARVLGKSESAVRALLFRARTRLRQRLDSTRKGASR